MTGLELVALFERIGPVLVFLLAITVVAEIADAAGVFDVAGHWAARAGRHRTPVLWLLFVAVAVACTIVLSLDTTAVLLTPVGLAVARQLGISPAPFALTTLWLANTASLLLPVSNLTNLLALHQFERLGLGHSGYVRLAALPALGAVAGTVAVLFVLHRRELSGRYVPDAPPDPHDRVLLRAAAGVCLAIGPLFALGLNPAVVSTGSRRGPAAGGRAPRPGACCAASRSPGGWRWASRCCSWWSTSACGTACRRGWRRSPVAVPSPADLARLAALGAVAANTVNNLPAYLALESVARDDPQRLMALIVGVDVGPLVTPWVLLATLLWAQRCRAARVTIPAWSLAVQGLLCAAVAGSLALLPLLV